MINQKEPIIGLIAGIILLIALGAGPLWGLYPMLGISILIAAIFTTAYHLLLNYLDLASLGHAAFFGSAAYVTGFLAKYYQLDVLLLLAIGLITSSFIGLIIGIFAIKRKGIYFTMITLALAELIYFLAVQMPATGGEDGLQGIPRGYIVKFISLESDWTMYYLAYALLLISLAIIWLIGNSPFGMTMRAIRDHSERTKSIGYYPQRYILLAFIISAGLSGLAGSLSAIGLGFVTLSDVHWTTSGFVLLMVLAGGIGSTYGPLLGAALITLIENRVGIISTFIGKFESLFWLSKLTNSATFIVGIIFIMFVIFLPRGIANIGIRST